ncbi:AAA family ATPase [bacterium]|nr:AAA family ATPase [bacterium]
MDDIILEPKTHEFIKKCLDKKTIPHFLFHGKQGMGKTSLAKIIVKQLECDHIYINASDTRGIDTVRDEIKNFVQLLPSNGNMQVVILDEFDGFTADAMRALRNMLEEYSETNRFIFTCNDINRVIEPIRSRVQEVNIINPPIKPFVERCVFILKNENIKLTPENKDIVTQKVKAYYPDLRKIIHELQTSLDLSLNINENVENLENFANNLLKKITEMDFISLRKYIIENEKTFDSNYYALLRKICEVLFYSDLPSDRIKPCFLEISEAIYRSKNTSDQEINFSSCMAKLQDILRK